MKYFRILTLCLISSLTYAQYDVTTVGNSETWNNSGLWVVSKGTTENIGGSLYMLNNWFTKGYLTTTSDITLSIFGVNYDTKNDAFVVKVAKDSIFMFDDSKLKEVRIDDKKFKKYINVPNIDRNNSYLEVLANTNDIEILKFYGKKLKEGKKDPLTQISTPDKYIDFNKIYFKKGSVIKEIKLNNKQFCKLFGGNSKEIKKYIFDNNLSLKNEKNLQKILNYYNTL